MVYSYWLLQNIGKAEHSFFQAMTSFRVAQLRKVSWSLPNGELQVPHDECISRHVDFLELQLKLQLYPKGDLDVLRKRASFFFSISNTDSESIAYYSISNHLFTYQLVLSFFYMVQERG